MENPRRGARPQANGQYLTERTSIQFTPEEKERLLKIAQSRNLSIAYVVREALTQYLETVS